MDVGEERIINVLDKDKRVVKSLTLIRTGRPYAYDLADAYDGGLTQQQKAAGLRWVVSNGQATLITTREWTNEQTERLRKRSILGG
jgi:hypothetical protein